jgi:polysaccharide biosynthesis transport protein
MSEHEHGGLVMPEDEREAPGLVDYLNVLRRRKWIFLLAVVLVPAVAVGLSLRGSTTYDASARVLLNQQNPVESLTGVQATSVDPARAAQTQAELARVPEVARRALDAARVRDLSPSELLKSSSVSASLTSDFLTVSVTNPDRAVATRLAGAYAKAFTDYRHGLDMQELARARGALQRRIKELEDGGLKGSALYKSLVRKQDQLTALDTLQTTPGALVVSAGERAKQVGSNALRNGMIGLVLGGLLGLTLVFLWDALDTRVRSVDTIRRRLGLRLLGRLPTPPRHLRNRDRLVMIDAPRSHEAEAVRVLRASLEFANADRRDRTVMVTSAVGGEGKSTTVANVAVALARAGRRVVLVDLDLRRPHLHRLFGLDERPGLIDVQLMDVPFERALRTIPIAEHDAASQNGTRSAHREGRLEVLTAGNALQLPDELAGELALARIVEAAQSRADLVLIDAAPLLPVGDAIAMSGYVDALMLVLRLDMLRSSALDDLRRILESSPAHKLGFVVTGTGRWSGYGVSHRYFEPQRRDRVAVGSHPES